MEKDKKEFQNKNAMKLAELMADQTLLDQEKIIFIKNIKNGSHLYIDPLVDTVKKTLKSKFPFQTKFNALMLLKDAMDTRQKEMADYVTIKILDRLKTIAKQSLKGDKNKLFNPPDPGDEFYLLLLECLYNWSIYFQLSTDQKMQPSPFKTVYSELLQAGIRFPTQFKYFKKIEQIQNQNDQKIKKQQPPKEIETPQRQQINQETPKPIQKPPVSDQNKNDKSAFITASETFESLKGLLLLVVDVLKENEDVSYLSEFCPELQQIVKPIQNQMNELEEIENPHKEILIDDLIKLSTKTNELISDIEKCQKKSMSWNAFKNKHHPKLQDFISTLKFHQEEPKKIPKVEKQKQSSDQIQEVPKQVPQNDNPFCFTQVANFEQDDIEKTQQDLIQQKLQKQQNEQAQIQPPQQQEKQDLPQIQQKQELPQIQQEQTPKQDQWDSQVPISWNQQQQEVKKIPESDFQFDNPDNQFQTQWNMADQKQDQQQYFENPFQQGFDNKANNNNLPFDSKRINTDPDSYNGWGIQQNQQNQVQWDQGFDVNQNIEAKDSNQDKEEVKQKMRPTMLPQAQSEPSITSQNNDEQQFPNLQWNVDSKPPQDVFTGHSNVMGNRSEFKTEVDSKPDSNIFKFNEPYPNLESMASKSVDSYKEKPISENEQENKQNVDDFTHMETDFNLQWDIGAKKQNPDDIYSNKLEFVKQNSRYKSDTYSDQGSKVIKFENIEVDIDNLDPFKKPNQLSNNIYSTKNMQTNSQVIQISLDFSIKSRKNVLRMADAEVQTQEQLNYTILMNDPQQEKNHQEEKRKLNKEIQRLSQSNTEYEFEIKQYKSNIEKYEQDFKQFKLQSQKWTDVYNSMNKQLINLTEFNKQSKLNIQDLSAENKTLKEQIKLINNESCENQRKISDYQCNQDSLLNKIKMIEKQFKQISANNKDHKCPITQYLEQFLKTPNLIETNVPVRFSIAPKDQNKISKIEINYDASLFLDILTGCSQPYSNQIDDFKFSLLMSRAVLYEDKVLQVGCITKMADEDLNLQLHIRNKSQNNISITKINLQVPSNNQLNALNVQDGSVLEKYTTFKIQLKFQYTEFLKQPILEFSINEQQYHILLPVSLIKFGLSQIEDIVTLKEKWKDNKHMKCVIKSNINTPNHKFINQLVDFKRYFQSLVQSENCLIMQMYLNQIEFGIKFKEDRQRQRLMIKIQSSQLLRAKAEDLMQQILFLFNDDQNQKND
ncbi:unnamed protein product [Paramecium sonneborni]|uniref:Uncharacterized protein n=1 Tax=Paramecium sonneborni TaxID=65129 RepID=A0A8S1P9M1_9CILI|nr:unnamed protein product [Paramecium sonneborni]